MQTGVMHCNINEIYMTFYRHVGINSIKMKLSMSIIYSRFQSFLQPTFKYRSMESSLLKYFRRWCDMMKIKHKKYF